MLIMMIILIYTTNDDDNTNKISNSNHVINTAVHGFRLRPQFVSNCDRNQMFNVIKSL